MKGTDAVAIGTVIRALRHGHGLNQTELARRLGKPPATVSAWELGKAMPEAANLVALAEALKTTVSDLLVRSGLQGAARGGRESWPPLVPSADPRGVSPSRARGLSERIPCFKLDEFTIDSEGHPTGEAEANSVRSADNRDPHAYALQIRGNLLYPRFWEGDTLEVVTTMKVGNGQIAVVIHGDGRKWIRRVTINRRRQTVRCEPLNPSDRPLEFPLSRVLLHLVIAVKLCRSLGSPRQFALSV